MTPGSLFLGRRVRALRLAAGITQEQASVLTGLSFKFYQRLESGIFEAVKLKTIEAVADAYGLDLPAFFGRRVPKVAAHSKGIPPPHRPSPTVKKKKKK